MCLGNLNTNAAWKIAERNSTLRQKSFAKRIAYHANEKMNSDRSEQRQLFGRGSMSNLLCLGLSEQKIKETERNTGLSKKLANIIAIAEEELGKIGKSKEDITKQQGTLLYQLGTKVRTQCLDNILLVVRAIISEGIKSEAQVSAALDYLLTSSIREVNLSAFEKACGIGVIVTHDQIEDAVSKVIGEHRERLLKERYTFNTGKLLGDIRTLLPWADGAYIKKELKDEKKGGAPLVRNILEHRQTRKSYKYETCDESEGCARIKELMRTRARFHEVSKVIGEHRERLLNERYTFNTGKLLGDIRTLLPWADGAYIKKEVDLQIFELLGPKKLEEMAPKKKLKDEKKGGAPLVRNILEHRQTRKSSKYETCDENEGCATIEELMRTRARFHEVGKNYTTDGYIMTPNTKYLLEKHLEVTGGKVITRFPPEPNGVLHIGHAKAININFGYAKAYGGFCNLRFDDTNPEKEDEKFFKAIEDIISWLGYTPARITHSSDNFQQLYEDMKNGKFDEGEATLRLIMTLEEGKVDPVAYRIKYVPHPRTGDSWCIYPTYDYSHCLCDSIENITHSLCTKEFQSRRSSYYALCNMLDIYCPVQWEYGRLNMNYTVVSKRKIKKLIDARIVKDWDDPRLFTLAALRRRGIPAEAINAFVAKLGLTMTQMVIDPHVLDATVRDYLNTRAPRTMAVLQGLKVTIQNFDEMNLMPFVMVPDFPSDPMCTKNHKVAFDRVIYIERSDYKQIYGYVLRALHLLFGGNFRE
ncbi:tRNA ligase class I, catalytic domain protein [Dictyocaulus viviparus]|uniref:glutamine--tRNA ligase n=1 Tax=Dictyocaulus viviparus TaxID=29172 RepID=A0A0D8Y798_DICVI|nr:tRNA ligase class I, catalytic domain protein [Dictyocaulus viviparus]